MVGAFDETTLLVIQAQKGDCEAFESLCGLAKGVTLKVAYGGGLGASDADDLAQDVLLIAWRKLSQLRDPSCFAAWVKSIAHRTLTNKRVREKLPYQMREERDGGPVDRRTAIGCLLEREEQEAFSRSLLGLDEPYRYIMIAFYKRRLSLLQINAECGSPVGTIKRRLHDGRKNLARTMALYV